MSETLKLSIEWYSVITRRSRNQSVTIWPYATVTTLLESQGYPTGEWDFQSHYAVFDVYSTFGAGFPFLIVDGKAVWNVAYKEARLIDVYNTLGLQGRRVRIHVHIPQAGGPGNLEIAHLWQLFCDAIKAAQPFVEVGGATAAAVRWIYKWVKARSHRLANVPPGPVFSLVMSRKTWSPDELARMARISEEDAAQLLVLCRYRYSKRRAVYTRTRDSSRLVKRLNNIEQYDK